MPDILTDLSSNSLGNAIKSNFYSLFKKMSSSPLYEGKEDAHIFRWYTGVPHPWFNGILSKLPATEAAGQTIKEAIDFFQSKSVASFSWWMAPQLDPATWSPDLVQHGFKFNAEIPGMALKLADLPPSTQIPLIIQRVQDRQTLHVWVDTFIKGFDLPESATDSFLALFENMGLSHPIRHFLGMLDNQPVATSSRYLGAGVAGIYNVTTLEQARGQGIGTAITQAPLNEARDLGYHAGILQSSQMGYPVYQRLGFNKLCQMEYFYFSG